MALLISNGLAPIGLDLIAEEKNMETLDLKKDLKYLYSPSSKKVEVVQVPSFLFVMVDGAIEPGLGPGTSPLFQENLQALYGIAYTLKFMLKQRKVDPIDFPVMALEGLWWVEDGHFDIRIKDNWFYTVMILLPSVVTSEVFSTGLAQLCRKKGEQPVFSRLRLQEFNEGLSVQVLHVGPYTDEPATVARMESFAAENGYLFSRKHHEIYLGNPLRADPAKLRTILRHPVEKIS